MAGVINSKAAFVEDVNDATGEVDPKSRKVASGDVKRPSRSQSAKGKAPSRPASDSGVSGLSHATAASGDPSITMKAVHIPQKAEDVSAKVNKHATVTDRERPKESSKRATRQPSPEKPSRRRGSKALKPDDRQYQRACSEPNCSECQSQSQRQQPYLSGPGAGFPLSQPLGPGLYYTQPLPYGSHGPAHPHQTGVYTSHVGSRPPGLSQENRPKTFTGPLPSRTSQPPAVEVPYRPLPVMTNPNFDIYGRPYPQNPTGARTTFVPPLGQPSAGPFVKATPIPMARTASDGLNYSTRATPNAPPPILANPMDNYRQNARVDENFEITARPSRRASFKVPGGFIESDDDSESSQERQKQKPREENRYSMAAPARPFPRHSRTASDAVPRSRRNNPVLSYPHERQYESEYEYYDTDQSNQAVVARSMHHGRPSEPRRSEKWYGGTQISDPPGYRGNEVRPDYSTARRMSEKEIQATRYQHNVSGSVEPMGVDWVHRQRRQSNASAHGHTPSAISGSSHRSHRSQRSMGSRQSTLGTVRIDYNGHPIDIPEGFQISVEGTRLMIEEGRGKEKSYIPGSSDRSSAQASSAQLPRRSRAESEASRGRKQSARPHSRLRGEASRDGSYERRA